MVLRPMWIFRLSRMASRTSASQTKSTGLGAGAAGSGAGAACGGAAGVPTGPERASQLKPPLRAARNLSTTSAATFETTAALGSGCEQPHEGPDAGAATLMPREAR